MQRQRKKPTLLRDSWHFTHFEADNSLEVHSITYQVSPVTLESNHHDGHLPHGLAESRTGAITTSEFDQHNGHLPHGLAESRTGAIANPIVEEEFEAPECWKTEKKTFRQMKPKSY